jgi:hypothetical protein
VNGRWNIFQREMVDATLHCGVNNVASLGTEHVIRASVDQMASPPSTRLCATAWDSAVSRQSDPAVSPLRGGPAGAPSENGIYFVDERGELCHIVSQELGAPFVCNLAIVTDETGREPYIGTATGSGSVYRRGQSSRD